MSGLTIGVGVEQGLDELHDALGSGRTPSPEQDLKEAGQRTAHQRTEGDASETSTADGQPAGLHGEASNSPALSASNVPSLLAPSTSSISTIESTPTTSPRPAALKLGLPFEQHAAAEVPEKLSLNIANGVAEQNSDLPAHEEESHRNSNAVSIASTPDYDRFSNVQLATPTSSDSSPRMAIARRFSPTSERKRATRNFTIMPPLRDDEADPKQADGSDDAEVSQPIANQNHSLSIQTDMNGERDDSLQTPVVGSSSGSRALSPAAAQPSGSSPSPVDPLTSGGGVDFLLARLEKAHEDPASNRRSLEVREKLKEDFQRLQATSTSPLQGNFPHKLPHEGTNGSGGDEKTDWGELRASRPAFVIVADILL